MCLLEADIAAFRVAGGIAVKQTPVSKPRAPAVARLLRQQAWILLGHRIGLCHDRIFLL